VFLGSGFSTEAKHGEGNADDAQNNAKHIPFGDKTLLGRVILFHGLIETKDFCRFPQQLIAKTTDSVSNATTIDVSLHFLV
jgi:hypothetical protein